METIIKKVGIEGIQKYSADAMKKRVELLSLEANENLISALYAESLLPSLDEQIAVYVGLIEKIDADIALILQRAEEAKGQAGYNISRERKPLEETKKAYSRGRDKLLERKASTLERISNLRMDAQLIMHKIDHTLSIKDTELTDSLVTHIESLKEKLEAPAPTVELIEDEEVDADLSDTEDDVTAEKAVE